MSSCATAPPPRMDGNNCGRVKHPETTMLVADACGAHPSKTGDQPAYFYNLDGKMTARHQAVNNIGFQDGHVKGCSPAWMKSEVDNTGSPDPNDGHIRGAWFWWQY